jgi:hypothetical protein
LPGLRSGEEYGRLIVDRLTVLVVLGSGVPMLEVWTRTFHRFATFDRDDVSVILVVSVRRVCDEYPPLGRDTELE